MFTELVHRWWMFFCFPNIPTDSLLPGTVCQSFTPLALSQVSFPSWLPPNCPGPLAAVYDPDWLNDFSFCPKQERLAKSWIICKPTSTMRPGINGKLWREEECWFFNFKTMRGKNTHTETQCSRAGLRSLELCSSLKFQSGTTVYLLLLNSEQGRIVRT